MEAFSADATATRRLPHGGLKPTPQLQVQRVMKNLSSVHLHVQRALHSTRELDERFEAQQSQADKSAAEYFETHVEETDPDRLRNVRAEHRTALNFSEKKLQLTSDAHDMVERQLEKLDTAIEALTTEYGVPLSSLSSTAAANGHSDAVGGSGGSRGGGGGGISPAAAGVSLLDQELEETYCSCGRVSFGEMVCCDNPACALEWFHFECVGLRPGESPPGTWLCPICALLQNASVKVRAAVCACVLLRWWWRRWRWWWRRLW